MLTRDDQLTMHENWVRFYAFQELVKLQKTEVPLLSIQQLIDDAAKVSNFILRQTDAELHEIEKPTTD